MEVIRHKNNQLLKPLVINFISATEKSYPIYIDAETTLGWAHYLTGEYRSAESVFRKVLTDNPTWVNARLGLAYTLKAEGREDYQQEVNIINRLIPGYAVMIPHLSASIAKQSYKTYNLAWEHVFAKNYDAAVAQFERSKEELVDKDQWMADDGLAWVDFYRENYQSALQKFENVIRRNTKAALSYKGKAYTLLKIKEYANANKQVHHLLELQPLQGLDVFSYLAGEFIQANEFGFAKPIIDKGLYYYPASGSLLFSKAQLLWQKGDKKQVYSLIESASYYDPLAVHKGIDQLEGLDISKIKSALLNMGWGLYVAYDNEGALRRFDQYMSVSSAKPPYTVEELNAIRGQGFTYIRLGKNGLAKSKLNLVKSYRKSSELKPIVTYYYPKNQAAVPIYVDTETSLGWAQFSTGELEAAKGAFDDVLAKHPDWINARLGLAYVLTSMNDKEAAKIEVDRINKVAPGYGVVVEPPKYNPWSTVLKFTQAFYKPESVKNNSQAYQIDINYAPSANFQGGMFYNYQHINFRHEVQPLVPSPHDRMGYFFNLSMPHKDWGTFGLTTKGNYLFRTAYNDDGANNTWFPYFGVLYKTPNYRHIFEFGRAELRFKDAIWTKSEQFSLTYSTTAVEIWLVGVALYHIKVNGLGIHPEHFTAYQLNLTHYISAQHNVAGFVLMGRRKHAYGLDINKAYDIRDRQHGGAGITYTYNLKPSVSVFVDASYDRFAIDTDTSKRYDVYYFTAGFAF